MNMLNGPPRVQYDLSFIVDISVTSSVRDEYHHSLPLDMQMQVIWLEYLTVPDHCIKGE